MDSVNCRIACFAYAYHRRNYVYVGRRRRTKSRNGQEDCRLDDYRANFDSHILCDNSGFKQYFDAVEIRKDPQFLVVSGKNPGRQENAKKRVSYAVIGLVLILVSYAVIALVDKILA